MLPPITTEAGPPPDPDRTHPLIYAESCLRCARFLLAVWEAGGWIEKALERLILPPPKLRGESKTSAQQADKARLTSLAPSNTVPRSTIALWVSMAYSPQLSLLSLPQRLRILGEVSSIFGRIGYLRKESFVLREVAALCGEGVAGKGIEVFPAEVTKPAPPTIVEESEDLGDVSGQSITRSTTPLSRSTVSLVSAISIVTPERTASIVRTTSDTAGNESIIRVAEKVCEAFGIEVVPRVTKENSQKRKSILQGGAVEASLDGKGRFGWQALQVGVLRDAISIAEALPGSSFVLRLEI